MTIYYNTDNITKIVNKKTNPTYIYNDWGSRSEIGREIIEDKLYLDENGNWFEDDVMYQRIDEETDEVYLSSRCFAKARPDIWLDEMITFERHMRICRKNKDFARAFLNYDSGNNLNLKDKYAILKHNLKEIDGLFDFSFGVDCIFYKYKNLISSRYIKHIKFIDKFISTFGDEKTRKRLSKKYEKYEKDGDILINELNKKIDNFEFVNIYELFKCGYLHTKDRRDRYKFEKIYGDKPYFFYSYITWDNPLYVYEDRKYFNEIGYKKPSKTYTANREKYLKKFFNMEYMTENMFNKYGFGKDMTSPTEQYKFRDECVYELLYMLDDAYRLRFNYDNLIKIKPIIKKSGCNCLIYNFNNQLIQYSKAVKLYKIIDDKMDGLFGIYDENNDMLDEVKYDD